MTQGIRFSNLTPWRLQHIAFIGVLHFPYHWTSTPGNFESVMRSVASGPPQL